MSTMVGQNKILLNEGNRLVVKLHIFYNQKFLCVIDFTLPVNALKTPNFNDRSKNHKQKWYSNNFC